MSKPDIVGVTVSVDISDKSYGNGKQSFMNIQGRYPNPALLEDVLVDGLSMYFAAWESLMAARYAIGDMKASELKQALDEAKERLARVRKFLLKDVQPKSDVE